MEENKLLGDYRLIKQIGQGSLGTTYVAEHRFTKKKYVLKAFPEEFSADRAFVQRFEEEVACISAFEHPHFAKMYTVSFAQGIYFFVSDCIVDAMGETTNLQQYLRAQNSALTQEELFSLLSQIASVLDAGHAHLDASGKKQIHRGVKLNNILVSGKAPDIHLYLSDWGLTKIVGLSAALTRTFKGMAEAMGISSPSLLAKIGQDKYSQPAIETAKLLPLHTSLLQNFAFLAPEQKVSDPRCDERVDTYAFGVLAYYLLKGIYPEGAFDQNFVFNEEPYADWTGIIARTLQPDFEKRPQILSEFLQHMKIDAKKAYIAAPLPSSPVSFVKEEQRIVKEYAPEKREYQHIQPLHTEMVSISGGAYWRGSDTGCRDEMPRHQVEIDAFSIDIHPVTNEQFVRFLELIGGEKDTQHHDVIRLRDSRIKKSGGKFSVEPGYAKHPVAGVTWYGAVAYAHWVGKRLPTEAEWEIACSGGLGNPLYPTGDTIEKSEANFFSSDTTAVMSYPPNGYGCFDMPGNVYEWCYDWYEYNYYEVSAQEPQNPKGPLQGVYRVLRGGCWKSLKEDLRTSKRHRNNPGATNGTYGFRCAL
jgi:formylglycine-generating enzyme required for sulfatase activity